MRSESATSSGDSVAYPLCFVPLYKERIWGGRKLAEFPGRILPAEIPVGESWEVTDRPEGVSVVANGPDQGRTIRSLIEERGDWLTGGVTAPGGRFPWLVKFLDAREDLSLQVHPPARRATALGGEPKTEMWYVMEAAPGARLYTGLRRGVTRTEFEARTKEGTVAELFHVHSVRSGDVMFLPSGRVHALGGGNLVFEIQQNSDTTYRVFDWNRVGTDGRPRELHLKPSFESIDFFDCEPGLVSARWEEAGVGWLRRRLVTDLLFRIDHWKVSAGAAASLAGGEMRVIGCVGGAARITGGAIPVELPLGSVALIPKAMGRASIESESGAEVLVVSPGSVAKG